MKSLLLVVLLSSVIFGQEIRFENELEDFRLYGTGKLQNLRLKTSSKTDVTAELGTDCYWRYCRYDDDWEVMLIYLEPFMHEYKIVDNTELTLSPFPQFLIGSG